LEDVDAQLAAGSVDESSVMAALQCFDALHAYALNQPIRDLVDALETAAIAVRMEKSTICQTAAVWRRDADVGRIC
jgi:hypothetical protein